jgi:asparagine synthase (glutamine-hydrolysing)
MCGIAGFQGDFGPDILEPMRTAIAHRGPDGKGSCSVAGANPRDSAGFAFARLAIIDLSPRANQPMTVDCAACGAHRLDQLALVFNGEIYNFAALREELRGKGHRFSTSADSEVLLHLYAQEGQSMLSRLDGMFAFAIRDGRETRPAGIERGDVFIARDQLGIKPLYYSVVPKGVLFASEIKALLTVRAVRREVDEAALHAHLAYLWSPAPHTILRSVRKLEPGCAFVARRGVVHRTWRYYELPYGERLAATELVNVEAGIRQRVQDAVKRQLVADVPVGAFLSGGIDSTTVVAAARRAAPDSPLSCYCIGFANEPGLHEDEADLPHARRAAEFLGVPLTPLIVEAGIIDRLPEMLRLLDEPQADPAPINALIIAEHARDAGIKVLLSGAGGDDIFSGYRRHAALRFERLWGWLPSAVRASMARSARRAASGQSSLPMHGPLTRRLAKMFSFADSDADHRLISYFWWSTEELRRGLYTPELGERLATVDTAGPLMESLTRIPNEHAPLNRMLFLETKHFLADHNLNYTDRMGMAAGVEVRVPLLDVELVRYACAIPPELKQRGTEGKSVFRRAVAPWLPPNVVSRGKTGFGAPLRRWMGRELRPMVEDLLSETSLRARGWFRPDVIRKLIDLDRAQRIDGSYTILSLMCLELWARNVLDAPAA